jgi:hypothetical protein
MDLNHDKQIQSLLCYRYTIGQSKLGKGKGSRPGVKNCKHETETFCRTLETLN